MHSSFDADVDHVRGLGELEFRRPKLHGASPVRRDLPLTLGDRSIAS